MMGWIMEQFHMLALISVKSMKLSVSDAILSFLYPGLISLSPIKSASQLYDK